MCIFNNNKDLYEEEDYYLLSWWIRKLFLKYILVQHYDLHCLVKVFGMKESFGGRKISKIMWTINILDIEIVTD